MIINIDIMRGDRFVKTIKYKHCEIFKLNLNDVVKFITEKCPTLVGTKGWSAVLCGMYTDYYCNGKIIKKEFTLQF